MCGINGFTFQDSKRLRDMHAATRHRGPDDEGFFESADISLAHNRLSIIDLSKNGRQPMSDPKGRFTIVFNGEIYNYRELRVELEARGRTFRSDSDTEVLLTAFSEWGEACLPKLNGIFAFAVWDRDEQRLTLVRDQIGVKPLYYFYDGTRLIFSSELKALLVHDIPRVIDTGSLGAFFHFLYVPGAQTMMRGIVRLEPGHVVTFHKGALQKRRFWHLREGDYFDNRNDAVAAIRDTARRAVKRQLVSDRPLGIFLSGGIDSSCILGMMNEMADGPIKTFSVGYEQTEQAEKYNADAKLAEKTAAHFGATHETLVITARDVQSVFEKAAWHMDEPIANHVQPSTYLLAQYAKPHITVALGGDGGDELFGGYPRYWYSSWLDRLTGWAPDQLRGMFFSHNAKIAARRGVERHVAFVSQKESSLRRFLKRDVPSHVSHEIFSPFFTPQWKDATNQMMAVDVQTWLPDESLTRTDRMTMAHGLEERVPLLDPDLVELAFRIPSAWKVGTRRQGKAIFIDAMRPYLPPHVLAQEKRAWLSPMAKWIRGPLYPMVRDILSSEYAPGTDEFIDFAGARKMLDWHVEKRHYALNEIWSIVTFQLWYRQTFNTHKTL